MKGKLIDFKSSKPLDGEGLYVSELFIDTIQGEGAYAGTPAAFLRLADCHMNCVFCDTTAIWRHGRTIDPINLLALFSTEVFEYLDANNAHLVVTGGAPLLQQNVLGDFLLALKINYFAAYKRPLFIEIENEASIVPMRAIKKAIDCWNNSPKLSNSEVPKSRRYNIEAIKKVRDLPNSWFKFVISSTNDWVEIEELFGHLISKDKIILMPMGITPEELSANIVACHELAAEHGVHVVNRLHILEKYK